MLVRKIKYDKNWNAFLHAEHTKLDELDMFNCLYFASFARIKIQYAQPIQIVMLRKNHLLTESWQSNSKRLLFIFSFDTTIVGHLNNWILCLFIDAK